MKTFTVWPRGARPPTLKSLFTFRSSSFAGAAVDGAELLAKLVENGLMGEEEVLDQPYGSRSWIEFADALENHCGPKKKTRGDHARRRK